MIKSNKIFPIIAMLSGIVILFFGLLNAGKIETTYFLCGIVIWFIAFGYIKETFRMLLGVVFFGGIFAAIAYIASKNVESSIAMINRFATLFLSIVPSMACTPVRMTRSLSQLHTPRAVTLGMLIAMSFVPMLKGEVKRVREAMKTRGAGSMLNLKIIYRAFLVPLIIRLVNISDTLALSVETRGFSLEKVPYTIYKKEKINAISLVYLSGIIIGLAVVIIL